ncbi:MAG: hypothetical protein ABIM50_12795 [Novosphingobium sp.]
MTLAMRRNWLLGGLVAAVLLLLAYAWIDGGKRPLRNIAQPVAVPDWRG